MTTSIHTLFRRLRLRRQVWLRQRRALKAVQALGALDAHTLRDLGIDRGDLLSCAFDPADRTRVRAIAS